jgi:hypothetical protein
VDVAVDRTVHSRAGAVAAAVEYATLLSRLLPLDRQEAVRVVGDASSYRHRGALIAAVDRELVPLQERVAALPGAAVHRQSALATRVDAYSDGTRPATARVSVWVLFTIGLGSIAADGSVDEANPVARFATVILDLVWERHGWRLDGSAQRPGPTPLLDGAPQSGQDFATALDGFSDWRPA